MKKKICHKTTADPPCAKKDKNGDIVTNKEALEKLYVVTYNDRLKPNPVKADTVELKALKEYLFNMNFETAKENKSTDWTIDDKDLPFPIADRRVK